MNTSETRDVTTPEDAPESAPSGLPSSPTSRPGDRVTLPVHGEGTYRELCSELVFTPDWAAWL